ncbi:trichome birefringence-like protein 34 [Tanacetum coccineum]
MLDVTSVAAEVNLEIYLVTLQVIKRLAREWGGKDLATCYGETEPVMNNTLIGYGIDQKMLTILESTLRKLEAKGVNVQIINITQLTQCRKDAHTTIYRKYWRPLTELETKRPENAADCSHWCLPGVPDIWNELLLAYMLQFNGKALIERLRSKRILFVGDSLNRNQWISMICMLNSLIPGVKNAGRGLDGLLHTFKAIDYNISIDFYWAPMLVESNGDSPTNHRCDDRIVGIKSIEKHAKHWLGADILVFNSYHWWTLRVVKLLKSMVLLEDPNIEYEEVDSLRAYKMGLRTWSKWAQTHIDPSKTKLYFMGVTATHSRARDWGGENLATCYRETEPETNSTLKGCGIDRKMLSILESTLKKLEAKGLNVQVALANTTTSAVTNTSTRVFGQPTKLKAAAPSFTSTCDLFSGRWVYDNSSRYPLYKEHECPYLDDSFACQTYGRKDVKYLQWRWQPHSCNFPTFKGKALIERLRGKRILFVGDSLNRNQWISMICMLNSLIPGVKNAGGGLDGLLHTFKAILEIKRPETAADCSHWCLPGVPDIWNELLLAYIIQ